MYWLEAERGWSVSLALFQIFNIERIVRQVFNEERNYLISHASTVLCCGYVLLCNHSSGVWVNKPHANNNRIERLNGTSRERVKFREVGNQRIARLLKGRGFTIILSNQPHQALKGKTPAKEAGVDVNGWKELIQKSVTRWFICTASFVIIYRRAVLVLTEVQDQLRLEELHHVYGWGICF